MNKLVIAILLTTVGGCAQPRPALVDGTFAPFSQSVLYGTNDAVLIPVNVDKAHGGPFTYDALVLVGNSDTMTAAVLYEAAQGAIKYCATQTQKPKNILLASSYLIFNKKTGKSGMDPFCAVPTDEINLLYRRGLDETRR